jgi:hypothetical protein
MSRSFVSAGIALLMAAAQLAAQASDLPKPGVCAREGAKIAGREPLVVAKGVPAPRKVRNVVPVFPEHPADMASSGMWSGEVLIGTDGKVSRVWTIREAQFTPPFPQGDQAIADAIRQWEFEPAVVKSEATPVCMKVTMNVNWK